eukprot:COSAG02_NODE_9591_length_2168_cov_1.508942_1_plen_288_part_00
MVASAVAGGGCLVFKPHDVLWLRSEHRLVGRLIGTVPAARPAKRRRQRGPEAAPDNASSSLLAPPMENLLQKGISKSGAGLPLFLSAEETALAMVEKLVQVVPLEDTAKHAASERNWPRRPPTLLYDLWRRGFYVTTATKFGGEWLCYRADPISVHADFIVSRWPNATAVRQGDGAACDAAQVDVAAALGAMGINVAEEVLSATDAIVVGVADDGRSSLTTNSGSAAMLLYHGLYVGEELVARLRLAVQSKKSLVLAVERQGQEEEGCTLEPLPSFAYYRLTRRASR